MATATGYTEMQPVTGSLSVSHETNRLPFVCGFLIMGTTSAKPQVEHFKIHTCYTATFSRMPMANFDAEVVLDFARYFTQHNTDDNQVTSRSLCVAM